MERLNKKGIWLSGYLLIMLFLFTRGFYSSFFVFLISLLVLMIFLKEAERLFAWMIIFFFLGNLLLGYMDHFIEGFHLSPFLLIMLSQLLWLVPILLLSYVIKRFNQEINPYFHHPIFTMDIHLPLRIVISFKRFLLICGLFAVLAIVGTLLFQKEGIQWRLFLFILLFSMINAVLEEVLWRGILLAKLIRITNQPIGIIITSIAFGINTTMFGFSIVICITYIFLGLVLGYLTVGSKSILPAMIVHTLITPLLFMYGSMPLPV